MHRRDVRASGINELTVHLIRKQIQIVLLHQITDLVHLPLGIEITGRIVRIADKDGLRTISDQLLEFLDWRK